MQMPRLMAALMVRLGMLAEITVVGRRSGRERSAVINKHALPDGRYLVGAGDQGHQWALNLRAARRCRLTTRGRTVEYLATELDGQERATATRALAPPFADPARTMRGPVFRLDPVEPQ